MKKIFLVVIFSFLCGLVPSSLFAQEKQEKVDFALFVSPTCVHCNKLKREYWGELKEKYKDSVNFTEYDISIDGNNLIFADTAKAYGIEQLGYPAAVVGSTFLMGYPNEIKTYAEVAIKKAQALNEKTNIAGGACNNAEQAFKKITFVAN